MIVRNQGTVVVVERERERRDKTFDRGAISFVVHLHGIRKIWRSRGGTRTGIKTERYSRVKVTLVLTNTGYDSSTWRALNYSGLPTSADSRSSLFSLSLTLSLSLLSHLAGRESRLFTVFWYIAYLRARKLQSIKGPRLLYPLRVPRDIDLANLQHRALFAVYEIQMTGPYTGERCLPEITKL